ncbi:MAG: nitroreductase, partial [Frankiales bacterium]|nr:nitroreductase [Frankiales bacterium]
MEFGEVVRKRRMVRNYDPDRAVPRETLDGLLEYGIRAPSAGFSQGWRFLVLDNAADCQRFWTASTPAPDSDSPADAEPDTWLAGLSTAPALILALSDKDVYLDRYAAPDKGWTDRDEARWPVPYWDVDTGMASMLILLAAVDAGLVSCFFGVPPEAHERVRAEFAIAPRLRFVGVMSIGYAAPDRKSPSLKRGRRQLSDVVSYGQMD